jgi:hypothetical protein
MPKTTATQTGNRPEDEASDRRRDVQAAAMTTNLVEISLCSDTPCTVLPN